MTPLFDSFNDFCRQGGALTDYEAICEAMSTTKASSLMDAIELEPEELYMDEEYRDEREDSSRLADRHSC